MSDQIDVNQLSNALQQKVDLPSGKTQMDIDYVVGFQAPTSENNYTWYRLYKSGWVEQGGTFYQNATATTSVNLIVTMLDNYYSIMLQRMNNSNSYELAVTSTTTTSFSTGTTAAGGDYKWEVKGMAAQS